MLIACTDTSPPAKISITSPQAPGLVAVRDGLTATWQPATMKTPTMFEADVNGPYVVAVVCENQPLAATVVRQIARTPNDARDLSFCEATPTTCTITGHMAQAGYVQLGDSSAFSITADWNFQLSVPDGTYDLVATSSDHITFRRGIAITGDLAVTPAVDVVAEGTALADVTFSVTNANPDEMLAAVVALSNSTMPHGEAPVYVGAPGSAKVAPDSALRSTDTQTVFVQAGTDNTIRGVRRPFRVGADTTFKLPDALKGMQWSVDGGKLSTSWTSLPELDVLFWDSRGQAASNGPSIRYSLDASSRFLADTAVKQLTFDTELPGYLPAWKIDFTAKYDSSVIAQKGPDDGEHSLSVADATFNAPALRGSVTRARVLGRR